MTSSRPVRKTLAQRRVPRWQASRQFENCGACWRRNEMQPSSKPQLQRREGDAIHISGDYQAKALKSDRAAQRFWHEAKFRLIERVALPGKQDRVLDAGCGSGTISHFLSLHAGQVIGMDSNPSAISYARTAYDALNLQFRLGQFEDLVGDEPFNRIYCIEVVEHLYEHQVAEVLSLFHKMTNPGGQLFLTLAATCERAGWRVHRIGTFNGLAPFLAPISHGFALGIEKVEFLLNRALPQNLLFCLCTREV
ncbi:MAG: hypothetical protein DMF00_15480 [Verrucomicrobia bacterium]|nr:MAG: hypothetical protein DMF00_15480 [Verrucomicrobiota bacterium]